MKRYVIDSVDSIRTLFADLFARTGTPFLPESDLAEWVDAAGVPVFSKAELAYFDDLILDCFVYCTDHHLDIDAIADQAEMTYNLNGDVWLDRRQSESLVVSPLNVTSHSFHFSNPSTCSI